MITDATGQRLERSLPPTILLSSLPPLRPPTSYPCAPNLVYTKYIHMYPNFHCADIFKCGSLWTIGIKNSAAEALNVSMLFLIHTVLYLRLEYKYNHSFEFEVDSIFSINPLPPSPGPSSIGVFHFKFSWYPFDVYAQFADV